MFSELVNPGEGVARCGAAFQPGSFVASIVGEGLSLCTIQQNTSEEPGERRYIKTELLHASDELDPVFVVEQIPSISDTATTTAEEESTGRMVVTVGCSGRTCILGVGPPSESFFSDTSPVLFDPSELFTTPLRAFVAGHFGEAPPASATTTSNKNNNSRAATHLSSGPRTPESCFVYCLGNGEILVFHSFAQQVGSLRGFAANRQSLMSRLMADRPQVTGQLASIASALPDILKPEEAATPQPPLKLEQAFSWALTATNQEIEEMEQEVLLLRQKHQAASGSLGI
jgi:hypothetical protein